MKKILSIALISAVVGTSAFAGDVTYLEQQEKTLAIQGKHINIKDSGLKSSMIYGLSYTMNNDLGQTGAWGLKVGFEFNYGKMDYTDKSGNITYTEFSWLIAPTYTFSCNARAYAGVKVGYVGFSDKITSKSATNAYVAAGVVGAEYPIMKHLVIGAQAEFGNTYIESESYSTTTFGGYVGYKF